MPFRLLGRESGGGSGICAPLIDNKRGSGFEASGPLACRRATIVSAFGVRRRNGPLSGDLDRRVDTTCGRSNTSEPVCVRRGGGGGELDESRPGQVLGVPVGRWWGVVFVAGSHVWSDHVRRFDRGTRLSLPGALARHRPVELPDTWRCRGRLAPAPEVFVVAGRFGVGGVALEVRSGISEGRIECVAEQVEPVDQEFLAQRDRPIAPELFDLASIKRGRSIHVRRRAQ